MSAEGIGDHGGVLPLVIGRMRKKGSGRRAAAYWRGNYVPSLHLAREVRFRDAGLVCAHLWHCVHTVLQRNSGAAPTMVVFASRRFARRPRLRPARANAAPVHRLVVLTPQNRWYRMN